MRVLVTGAAGAIGEPVCAHLLAEGDFVRAFDRRPSKGTEVVVAELDDAAAVRRAVARVDAVIHLAAQPFDAPFPELVAPNVLGLYHVLDAARVEGVRRVVLASTIQVLRRGAGERITDAPHHRGPTNHYALTKVFAEEMGQMYATCFGLEVIAARIGFMVRDAREARILTERKMYDRYLSRADAARFCHAAVHAPFEGFAVLHVIGPDGRERFDLDTPRRLIGYEPRDAWPEGLPFPAPARKNDSG